MDEQKARSADPPLVSIVVPVFNEEESLPRLDAELREIGAELPGSFEIVYVDDRSLDGSFDLLTRIAEQRRDGGPATRVVRLRRNFGQTAAMAAGFQEARGEIVVPLDADGQNDPKDVPRLVERILDGDDVVSGWRRHRRDGFLRVLLSRIANRLIAWISGVPLHDTGCTLKAYRRSVLSEIHLHGDMHRFIPVYLARQGARVAELEVAHRPRFAGRSKYGNERIVKVLLDLILLLYVSRYFSRPMHFFGQVGFFFGVCAGSVAFLMVAFKFSWLDLVGLPYQADFVETPLPALAATFLAAAISALLLGVLGELLIRIYFEFEGARSFVVDRVVGGAGPESGHDLDPASGPPHDRPEPGNTLRPTP